MSTPPRRPRRPVLCLTRLESRLTPAGVHFMGPQPLGAYAVYEGTAREAWTELGTAPEAPAGFEQVIRPDRFLPLALDADRMRAALPATVHTVQPTDPSERPVLTLPKPDGTLERFEVWGADAVAPELWAEGTARTYRGVGLDDPSATLVADFTTQGFHAQVQTPGGWWYIDPLFYGSQAGYQSYFRADYTKNPNGDRPEAEDVEPEETAARGGVGGGPGFSLEAASEKSWAGTLRTYRAAVSTDDAYYAYNKTGAGTADQNVLSAVTTALNRVSGIYETELSMRFQLVANNASVIYGSGSANGSSSGIYSSTSASTAIGQIQTRLDSVIGSANYEIGHLFSGVNALAGLAGLGVIARNGSEGRGVSGIGTPAGDVFAVDYVAHEMGHQSGANHTFAATANANVSTAMNPGMGIAIMDYAGLQAANDYNTAPFATGGWSIPYFSWKSLQEISNQVQNGTNNGGFTTTAVANAAPRVSAGADVVIPARTLFSLSAIALDPDGTPFTYSWEQGDGDTVTQNLNVADDGTGALFRIFPPTSSPDRWFPNQTAVLASTINFNGSVNLDGTAASGTSYGYVRGERLPLTTRDLNFTAVARDSQAGGGGFAYDRVVVRSVNTGSAFAVTLGTGLSWAAGSSQTVTWAVAGTTAAPISTDFVRILLSTDGGLTFPTVLSERTANDGTEAVTLPLGVSSAASGARLKVEPTNSVYFALSNKLTVTATGAAPGGTVSGVSFVDRNGNGKRDGEPAAVGRLVYADADANGRFDNGLPLVTLAGSYPLALADRTITRVPFTVTGVSGNVTGMTVKLNLTHAAPGELDVFLVSPTGRRVELFTVLGGSGANVTNLVLSATGTTGVNQASAPYTGTFRPEGNLAEFTGLTINGTWQLEVTDRIAGNAGTLTGWSITPAGTELAATGFAALAVPDAGSVTATLPAQLVGGPLQDVGVTLSLTHPDLSQIKAYLTSPAGTKVLLASGGSGADLTGTTFDDEAATKFAAGTAPYTGVFKPVEPLSRFDGEDGSGVWTLTVQDTTAGGTGSVTGWGVSLVAPTRAASVEVPMAVGVTASRTNALRVAGSFGTLSDLDVSISLTHPATGELTAYLTSPAGTKVTLTAAGTAGANWTGLTFDDEAATALAGGAAPYTGRFRPSQVLSAFDGQWADGLWTLQLDDSNTAANSGSLASWSLSYSTGERWTTTDAAGGYSFAVAAGTFAMREELPGDFTRTQPAAGSYAVSVTAAGQTFTAQDFGGYAAVIAGPTLKVGDGTSQRSRVTGLTLTGFGGITGASAGAFTLSRNGGAPQAVTASGFAAGPNDTTSFTLSLPAAFVDAYGSLLDGAYTLSVNWALVTASGPPLGGTTAHTFHRLYGDGNGDATVNLDDLTAFTSAFGTSAGDGGYVTALDYNADTTINLDDLTEFTSRFGVSV